MEGRLAIVVDMTNTPREAGPHQGLRGGLEGRSILRQIREVGIADIVEHHPAITCPTEQDPTTHRVTPAERRGREDIMESAQVADQDRPPEVLLGT